MRTSSPLYDASEDGWFNDAFRNHFDENYWGYGFPSPNAYNHPIRSNEVTHALPVGMDGPIDARSIAETWLIENVGVSRLRKPTDIHHRIVESPWNRIKPEGDWSKVPGILVYHMIQKGSRDDLHLRYYEHRTGARFRITLENGSWSVKVLTNSIAVGENIIAKCTELLKGELPKPIDTRVPMEFWSMGSNGPSSITRDIEVPKWDEVKMNYPEATRANLEAFIARGTPQVNDGRMVLLWGTPGTGKTSFLRTLAKEWSDRVTVSYIMDPEVFLNTAAYQMAMFTTDDTVSARQSSDAKKEKPRWRIILMEDCGELLGHDAKRATAGHGLSSLLNLSDGILGQGQRLMIAITTNEDFRSFHPAVSRPGRCLFTHEIGEFDRDEAKLWLGADPGEANTNDGRKGGFTLAELYAKKHADPLVSKKTEPKLETGLYL